MADPREEIGNRREQGNKEVDYTNLKWSPAEISFFDPKLGESHGAGDVVTIGANTFWRNVYK